MQKAMAKLFYEYLTCKIRGALFEVYQEKGCGFSEDVYQECLEIKLRTETHSVYSMV